MPDPTEERIPVWLTREQAEAMLTAIGVAQDEMPWSEFEEAWSAIAEQLRAAQEVGR